MRSTAIPETGAMSANYRRHRLAGGVLTLAGILGGQTGPGAQVGPYPVGPTGEAAPLICARGLVIDGDTLELVCGGEPVRVRLHCIDAPELGQGHWGRAAREHLRSLVPRTLIVLPKPTDLGYRDRFGRIVGELLSPDESRRNLNLALVLSGQVAVYPKYCTEERYYWVEQVARRSRVGIWSTDGLQQTPWVWRRGG
jgi:endonuclease YncB( thermonuclease family)